MVSLVLYGAAFVDEVAFREISPKRRGKVRLSVFSADPFSVTLRIDTALQAGVAKHGGDT